MKFGLWNLIGALASAMLVLAVAPLAEGILRKLTARLQSRKGPPLLQPYIDLLKLLGKEDIESGPAPRMQRFAAYLSLASVLATATLVPLGFPAPMNGAADSILLIYLLTLSGISTLLAGLAAGSTYSLLGISREMMTMITLEPLFAVAILAGALHTGSFRLETILSGSLYVGNGVPWSGLVLLGLLLLSFQAFVQRLPFDITEAETELMEGPLMEYSGPKLALFKSAQMCRLLVHSAIFIGLFAPWGMGLAFPLGLIVFWGKVLLLVLLVTVLAATHARYRLDQALRFFSTLLAIALCALILASYGY